MNTKLLAASLFIVLGAGCSTNVTTSSTSTTPTDVGQQTANMIVDDGAAIELIVNTSVEDDDTEEVSSIKEFTITGDNFAFAPTDMSVNEGDTVRITFTNAEGFHDFRIDEFEIATAQLNVGVSETVEFVADQPGTFEYYCSIGSHRAMGMKGVLTVN